MIYFTFFHSLFWQNTMKERGGLPFLVFGGPECSITQPRDAKADAGGSVYPLRQLPAAFTERGGADSSKEGHRHHLGRGQQGPPTPRRHHGLPQTCFSERCSGCNLGAGSGWLAGRQDRRLHFHKRATVADPAFGLLSPASTPSVLQFKMHLFLLAMS